MSEVITSVGTDAHKREVHVAMLIWSAAMASEVEGRERAEDDRPPPPESRARGVRAGAAGCLGIARRARQTLPVVGAVIAEILTAHFFVTRPHYLRTKQELVAIDLRIQRSRSSPWSRGSRRA